MFCSNCGNRLADGAKFCSECGTRVQDAAEQEFRFGNDVVFEEPKRETVVFEREETPAPRRESVSFDWSAVVDEPHKKEIPDVKSPWGTTGGINEKELYAEMTPSTDRSRTMSFIDVLKAEKEEREKKAEERAFVYTEVLEVDADMSSFNDAPALNYAPLYEDVDAPVKTPFDDIEREPERRTFDNTKEPAIETSRETIAQFDEYVKSFEAGAGIIHDEPRFEQPAPPRAVSDEPKFELPDFLKRAVAPAKEEPEFEEPVFEEPAEEPVTLDFSKDIIDEPTFEVPKIEETEEEPAFEEPKYEEPAFEEPKYDEDDFDDAFDEYLDLDTGRDAEPVDEKALFAEMEETKPAKPGMTIAAPAEKEDEIEALRKRLMELTGTDIKLDEAAEEPEPAPAAEPEELSLEPETTADVDKVFDGLSAASETKEEPKKAEETKYENPEDLYLSEFPEPEKEAAPIVIEEFKPEPAAPAEEEPVLLVLDGADEPEPAAPAEEEPVLLILDDIEPEPAPAEEPAPAVIEEVVTEEAAVEEVRPAPAEEPKAEEPKAAEPEEGKSSDALSLEELEKDLFGETPTAEVEAEETKKIDKFYTLYRKNEEFQRLLDEEYDKLKGESTTDAPKADEKAGAAAAAEIPAEQSKAYRQVEDETIYKAFEIPPELVKAPPKEAEPAAANPPVPQGDGGTVYKKDDKKAAKAAAKAEKAKQKEEKKALKAKAKAEAASTGVEYEEVDTGSGFLTVLAVIIAIILVILLAVILILQVAPDSGIAIAIDSLIESITGGFGAIDPGNGQFLL